jgi:hypothetical protein
MHGFPCGSELTIIGGIGGSQQDMFLPLGAAASLMVIQGFAGFAESAFRVSIVTASWH